MDPHPGDAASATNCARRINAASASGTSHGISRFTPFIRRFFAAARLA